MELDSVDGKVDYRQNGVNVVDLFTICATLGQLSIGRLTILDFTIPLANESETLPHLSCICYNVIMNVTRCCVMITLISLLGPTCLHSSN